MKKKTIIGILIAILLTMGCEVSKDVNNNEDAEKPETVLTVFVQQSVSNNFGMWNGWGAEKLFEDTGIRLNFYPNGSGRGKMLQQYMAAGTLPDLIGFETSQVQLLLDSGLLLPLNQYEEQLPSVFHTKEYEKALEYFLENYGGKENKLYLLPVGVGEKAEEEYDFMPMLQWQPYEQVGRPNIETLNDYLDVVESMLQYRSTTALGDRVYGFSLFSEWDEYTAKEAGSLSYLYGIDTGMVSSLMELDMKSEKLSAVTSENSFYKKALHFYFEANQRGLLDPDSRTQTYNNFKQKYDKGRILFSNYSWLTENYNAAQVEKGYGINSYVAVVADDMKIYKKPDNFLGNGYFGINSNSQNKEKVCQLLNWLYDPENISYLYNGPVGVTWEILNGEPVITEKGWDIIRNGNKEYMPNQGGTFNGGLEPFHSLGLTEATVGENGYSISYRYWPSTLLKEDLKLQKQVNEWRGGQNLTSYLKANDRIIIGSNAVNLMPEASASIRANCTKVGEVVRKLSWDMIYASDETQFEQLWQEMVKKSNELGMNEIEVYYQILWKKALEKESEYEQSK